MIAITVPQRLFQQLLIDKFASDATDWQGIGAFFQKVGHEKFIQLYRKMRRSQRIGSLSCVACHAGRIGWHNKHDTA